MKRSIFIVFLCSVLFFSCKKKDSENSDGIDLGLSYYPKDLGKFVIYDVDSTIYTDLSKDTLVFKYRIKEKFVENYTDNLGLPAIRVMRYIKKYDPMVPYDSMPWSIKEAWTVSGDQRSIQVVESNLRFTKLIFPVQLNSTWNGNANNSNAEQMYFYEYIDKAETIGNVNLSQVLQVKQKSLRTLISYQNYVEKYAKGVGLVYREITDLQSNNIIANKDVEERIEQGIIYKQTLLTHGSE